jgi:hypothetical protein
MQGCTHPCNKCALAPKQQMCASMIMQHSEVQRKCTQLCVHCYCKVLTQHIASGLPCQSAASASLCVLPWEVTPSQDGAQSAAVLLSQSPAADALDLLPCAAFFGGACNDHLEAQAVKRYSLLSDYHHATHGCESLHSSCLQV